MRVIFSKWRGYSAAQMKIRKFQQQRTQNTTQVFLAEWREYLVFCRWTLQHCWRCLRPYKMAILHAERQVTFSRIIITMQASFEKWRSLLTNHFIKGCISRRICSFRARASLKMITRRILSEWREYCDEDYPSLISPSDDDDEILNARSHQNLGGQTNNPPIPPAHAGKKVTVREHSPRIIQIIKLVKDDLYPFVQRPYKHSLWSPGIRSIPWRKLPNPISSSKSEDTLLESDREPDLVSSSEDEKNSSEIENDSYSDLHYPRMLGGGIHDSDEPRRRPPPPPIDADSDPKIAEQMTLELEKALARTRKKRPANPNNAVERHGKKRTQSKVDYDRRIFNLTMPKEAETNEQTKIESTLINARDSGSLFVPEPTISDDLALDLHPDFMEEMTETNHDKGENTGSNSSVPGAENKFMSKRDKADAKSKAQKVHKQKMKDHDEKDAKRMLNLKEKDQEKKMLAKRTLQPQAL
jgi:hypothetical protein